MSNPYIIAAVSQDQIREAMKVLGFDLDLPENSNISSVNMDIDRVSVTREYFIVSDKRTTKA